MTEYVFVKVHSNWRKVSNQTNNKKFKIDEQSILDLKVDHTKFIGFMRSSDEKTLVSLLSRLGRLNSSNQYLVSPLIELLQHRSVSVRVAAAHNLGKFGDDSLLPALAPFVMPDQSTDVRREIVSAIGRMRSLLAVELLTNVLKDEDPKVILQAIRGLLVFKKNPEVMEVLRPLTTHPNEEIKRILVPMFDETNRNNTEVKKDVAPVGFMTNTVVKGDVLQTLMEVPDEEVHLTFTSPPYYNARDYSIYRSYGEYLEFLKKVFEGVHRVTREGRFLIVNTSPVIVSRFSRSHASRRYPIPFDIHAFMASIGWEYIDDIIWLKPEASVKNRNAGFLQHRKPLGYKPNTVTEMLMVYRKKTDRLIDWNMKQYDKSTIEESLIPDGFETSNVWKIDPKFNKIHSAVFPVELCEKVISYYSFKGDLVFDPFAGSGTLGKAALGLGRVFFLTEMNEQYFDLMRTSLSVETKLFDNFDYKPARFVDIDEFKRLRLGDAEG